MMRVPWPTSVVSLALLVAACSAPPEMPEMPAGPELSAGLEHVDATPPVGAQTWSRPVWRVGDRFTLVRGDQLRGTFEVVGADGDGYRIDVGDGRVLRRDLDLGNLGNWSADSDEPVRVMTPVDVRYHWPLWVGKRWTCRFVDRMSGGKALPMTASYVVESLDTVSVPAGTYRALRIVRRLQLSAEQQSYLTRTQMIWYAPEEGLEVRQLLGDTLVELIAFERQ